MPSKPRFTKAKAKDIRKAMRRMNTDISQNKAFAGDRPEDLPAPLLIERAGLLSTKAADLESNRPLQVVHVGNTNVGKTTGVKALVASTNETVQERIEQALLVKVVTNTTTPVHVVFAEKPADEVQLYYHGQQNPDVLSVAAYAQLAKQVKYVDDPDTYILDAPGLENVAFAEVSSDAPILHGAEGMELCIIDTPGLLTDNKHSALVAKALATADVVVAYFNKGLDSITLKTLEGYAGNRGDTEDVFAIIHWHSEASKEDKTAIEETAKQTSLKRIYVDPETGEFDEDRFNKRFFQLNAMKVPTLKLDLQHHKEQAQKGLDESGFQAFEDALKDLAKDWKENYNFPRYPAVFKRLVLPVYADAVRWLDTRIQECNADVARLNEKIKATESSLNLITSNQEAIIGLSKGAINTVVETCRPVIENYLSILTDKRTIRSLLESELITAAYKKKAIAEREAELESVLPRAMESHFSKWAVVGLEKPYEHLNVLTENTKRAYGKLYKKFADVGIELSVSQADFSDYVGSAIGTKLVESLSLESLLNRAGGWTKIRVAIMNFFTSRKDPDESQSTFEKRLSDYLAEDLWEIAPISWGSIAPHVSSYLQAEMDKILAPLDNKLKSEVESMKNSLKELRDNKVAGNLPALKAALKKYAVVRENLTTSFDSIHELVYGEKPTDEEREAAIQSIRASEATSRSGS